jgi:purine-binding chemotaxis protein CheW
VGISDARKKIMRAGTVRRKQAEDETQIVVFRLGGEEYGIEIGQVREIIRKREITPMPRQPAYVEGVINVRGTIIPVVNLKKRFGLSGDVTSQPHTIIVDSVSGVVGLLVEEVREVIRVSGDHIHPPPTVTNNMDSECLRGICRVGDRLLIYLDVEKVVKGSLIAADSDSKGQGMTLKEPLIAQS